MTTEKLENKIGFQIGFLLHSGKSVESTIENLKNIAIDYAKQFQTTDEKKLIQLRTKLNFYKKLEKKIDSVMEGDLEIDDWSTEVYNKNRIIETELEDLKLEMNLTDDQWDQDEIK